MKVELLLLILLASIGFREVEGSGNNNVGFPFSNVYVYGATQANETGMFVTTSDFIITQDNSTILETDGYKLRTFVINFALSSSGKNGTVSSVIVFNNTASIIIPYCIEQTPSAILAGDNFGVRKTSSSTTFDFGNETVLVGATNYKGPFTLLVTILQILLYTL